MLLLSSPAWALDSDKDLTLDDGSGDSPSVVVSDAADTEFRMQKKSGGGGELQATSGSTTLKPSGVTNGQGKAPDKNQNNENDVAQAFY